MKVILSVLIIVVSFSGRVSAQYVQQGKIVYERKINDHAVLDDFAAGNENGNNDWVVRMKKETPKFRTNNFDLSFTAYKSIYTPEKKDEDDKTNIFLVGSAAQNTVLTDYKTKQVTASKTVFEKTFLVKDTMRVMQWKILSEIRTIGDYRCRKAVGRIFDSVVVVAFYTDDIMVSGGPEMFGGLPGMIMELAIPRLHATWIATKVEFTAPDPNDMVVSGKGKAVTEKELAETLKRNFSDWGKQTNRFLWWSLI